MLTKIKMQTFCHIFHSFGFVSYKTLLNPFGTANLAANLMAGMLF